MDRLCTGCNQLKTVSWFGINRATKTGLDWHCKPCRSEAVKQRRNARKALGKCVYCLCPTNGSRRCHDCQVKRYKALKSDRAKWEIYKLRCRFSEAVSGAKVRKSVVSLLGISVEGFLKHIESKFTDGMSWSNSGKWHYDHIKPVCSFDHSKPEDVSKCWHYTNFQPLWAAENIRKGARQTEEKETSQ